MKHRYTLFLATLAMPVLLSAQSVLYAQNFDALAPGGAVAATLGAPWTTWSAAPGGPEDAIAFPALSYSPPNAMLVMGDAKGGVNDMLLLLGEPAAGHFLLSMRLHVMDGTGGMLVLWEGEDPLSSEFFFALDLYDAGQLNTADGSALWITYPEDTWFLLEIDMDLDAGLGELRLDGAAVASFPTNLFAGTLGSLQFYGFSDQVGMEGQFFVDDVEYVEVINTAVPQAIRTNAALYVLPNPAHETISISGLPVGVAEMDLMDATGHLLRRERINSNGSSTNVGIAELPAGTYLLRAVHGDGIVQGRFVKR